MTAGGLGLRGALALAAEAGGGHLLAPERTHFAPRAKSLVFIFLTGGFSHVDTFDPKPRLRADHGKVVPAVHLRGADKQPLMGSPFAFRACGRSGLLLSELFPRLGTVADDLCVLRAMHTDTAAHSSGCLQLNTGSPLTGRPSLGAWLSYGLGSLNENLPSYVVMTDPRGGPIGSASNWGAGYMPAAYQGTLFRSGGAPLLDLATPPGVCDRTQRGALDLLRTLNEAHRLNHPNESELAARIHSYELAYQMQTSASAVVDLAGESESTRLPFRSSSSISRLRGCRLPMAASTPSSAPSRCARSPTSRARCARCGECCARTGACISSSTAVRSILRSNDGKRA